MFIDFSWVFLVCSLISLAKDYTHVEIVVARCLLNRELFWDLQVSQAYKSFKRFGKWIGLGICVIFRQAALAPAGRAADLIASCTPLGQVVESICC